MMGEKYLGQRWHRLRLPAWSRAGKQDVTRIVFINIMSICYGRNRLRSLPSKEPSRVLVDFSRLVLAKVARLVVS
jgi:hypothetical protein